MSSTSDQEIEVKFYLPEFERLLSRLEALHASLQVPRTHEFNLRFDTATQMLSREHRMLRLRQDTHARMTYKGPSTLVQGVRRRPEIEFQVSSFEAAQNLLQALGYQVIVVYEKYRTQYNYRGIIVCLDELPFGHFVELEGPSPEAIRQVAGELHLNWDARILKSYLYLFQQVRDRLGLTFRDLTFENFRSIHVTPEMLDVQPAIPG